MSAPEPAPPLLSPERYAEVAAAIEEEIGRVIVGQHALTILRFPA